MQTFLAAVPILLVLCVMLFLRWGGQRAGPFGWLACLVTATLAFGLTWQVFWVSQAKGLFLSLFVLAVLWPALFLYNVVDIGGGIRAIAHALERIISDRGILLIVLPWAFSGMLQGLAGFGLPIAIVAPMLASLGVQPVAAVAAVAVGHSWAVTFGDMGVVFQTLTALVSIDEVQLVRMSGLLLGVACLLCGLVTARIVREGRRWPVVVVLAAIMGATQYGLAYIRLVPLAALGAGLAGVVAGGLFTYVSRGTARRWPRETETGKRIAPTSASKRVPAPPACPVAGCVSSRALAGALASYGGLTALMIATAVIHPLREVLYPVVWQMHFPEVATLNGFITEGSSGQAFRPLVHPGTSILLVGLLSSIAFARLGLSPANNWKSATTATWRSAWPASIGIVSMVGLSTMMDHTGMTMLLAQSVAQAMGAAFPVASPLVGILGAFATGSNNNSNVLFASLQHSAGILLSISPVVLLAAQTAGGALGSMLAPAKIIVGCSTVGLVKAEGDVLKITLVSGLSIGLLIGVLAVLLARI